MNDLKQISPEAIPRAVELAERYRLLNEPEQATSICHDILAIDANNQDALRTLFLATTEQFSHRHGTQFEEANAIAGKLGGEYEHAYYGGIACERWARAKLQQGAHASMVGDWVRRAMEQYAKAESIRPTGNDDAILRWNACARLLQRVPGLSIDRESEPVFGD